MRNKAGVEIQEIYTFIQYFIFSSSYCKSN